jgi:Zn-finger nucleic acid-binding protein
MDCPKCVGKLEHKSAENVELDVCFVCEGIWLDTGELEKVIEADSKDFKFISLGREELDGKEISDYKAELDEKEGICPRCGNGIKLLRKEYQGKRAVNVDACPECKGIWLDGGEIKELRRRGLVDVKDKIDDNASFLKYIFSRDALRHFIRQVFGR